MDTDIQYIISSLYMIFLEEFNYSCYKRLPCTLSLSIFSAHWFLAIICFPGLSGPVRIADGLPVPVLTPDKPKRRRSNRPKNRIEVSIIKLYC